MESKHRKYELYLILSPKIDSETSELERCVEILKNVGGVVDCEFSYGKSKLAYKIKQNQEGYVNVIQFISSPEVIKDIERDLGHNEKVLRFLVTALDKHAIAYYDSKRKTDKQEQEKESLDNIDAANEK